MRRLLPVLTATLALWLAGCPSGTRDCVTTADCFAGEVCRADGVCGDPIPDTGTDAGPNGDTNNETPDMSTPDDSGPAGDTATNDAQTPDTRPNDDGGAGADASDDVDAAPRGPCYFDPFEQCTDDENPDNNSFPGEYATTMTRGCVNDEFKPLDMTISGRMCPLDPMDMYEFLVVECYEDEGGFAVEAILDVKDDCDPDDISFSVGGIGNDCDDPGDRVRCETLPDGRRRIRVLYPGTSNAVVGSIRFSVETPDRDDIAFDYDLQLVVRR